ncbi:DapH/DapD/GlmU-related protein [Cetobacterium sp.]|uniref:DapH/DapD/GlmU-related protein n=1 Tax=Cetobacterium sp. TaxID=2071632 RepID=UPI003EE7B749
MRQYLDNYGVSGIIKLALNYVRTKIFFKNARLIRFPFDLRGKKYIEIGSGFTTGVGCRIDAQPLDKKNKSIFIGNNVQINDYVHITGVKSVKIGDNVLIASKVYISDAVHGSYKGNSNDSNPKIPPNLREITYKEVIIEENVWIGENVSILPGVKIGFGSIIGANSVITKDVPKDSIVCGIPGEIIKRYNPNLNRWSKDV